jgi:hypothetical protein
VRPTHVDIREEQGCQVRKQGVRRRVSRGHRLLQDREIRVSADYLGGARVVAIGRVDGAGVLRRRVEQEHCHEKRAGRG